jgi:hypothetical protein
LLLLSRVQLYNGLPTVMQFFDSCLDDALSDQT